MKPNVFLKSNVAFVRKTHVILQPAAAQKNEPIFLPANLNEYRPGRDVGSKTLYFSFVLLAL